MFQTFWPLHGSAVKSSAIQHKDTKHQIGMQLAVLVHEILDM